MATKEIAPAEAGDGEPGQPGEVMSISVGRDAGLAALAAGLIAARTQGVQLTGPGARYSISIRM